jgi:hypothetical protein
MYYDESDPLDACRTLIKAAAGSAPREGQRECQKRRRRRSVVTLRRGRCRRRLVVVVAQGASQGLGFCRWRSPIQHRSGWRGLCSIPGAWNRCRHARSRDSDGEVVLAAAHGTAEVSVDSDSTSDNETQLAPWTRRRGWSTSWSWARSSPPRSRTLFLVNARRCPVKRRRFRGILGRIWAGKELVREAGSSTIGGGCSSGCVPSVRR